MMIAAEIQSAESRPITIHAGAESRARTSDCLVESVPTTPLSEPRSHDQPCSLAPRTQGSESVLHLSESRQLDPAFLL